jgi:hypothetical protein
MKTIFLMLITGLLTVSALAQNPMRKDDSQLTPQQKDRIESMRIAFISSKLELSPAQAEKFWPMYNEYHANQQKMRADMERLSEAEVKNLTEKEAREKLQQNLLHRQNELNHDKTFYKEMESVLSANQILMLSRVDGEFRRHMLRQARSASGQERLQDRQGHRMQREQSGRGQRNKNK